ncbi:sugar phosphate isomerase/epimerase family protein [Thermococcus waiotapuensis]|uniref:Sugar phosphate isomerase/epimerase family protein n=1 Tax=Thermococcus waiotapuensis TaxID=90909 RepID=A0AAE4NSQ8_9EURY|nr:sugar phosphate isomerase/epimerase family protein [Thermococcus waiotapuensis]MDV3103648.1 sugar phosphate isomerase/epimerase family protein [Thermococcus waiotapuensis]
MGFGVNSFIVKEITGRGFSLEELGVDFVELSFDDVKVLTEEGINWETLGNLEGLGFDFTLHAPTSDGRNVSLNLGVYTRTNISVMENVFRIASALNAEDIIIHGGDIRGDYHRAFMNTLRQFREIEALARDYGVRLLVENLTGGRIGAFPHELIPFIGENSAVCLDVGHAFLTAMRYGLPLQEFDVLSRSAREFHVHDNNGERDEHLPPGEGMIGVRYILRMIENFRPENVVFEVRNYSNPMGVIAGINAIREGKEMKIVREGSL